MKSIVAVAIVLSLLTAALVVAEKKKVEAPVSAQSILYLVADSQRDLTRMPSRFTRIPDADEKKFGDALAADILAGREMTEEDREIEAYLAATGARIARFVNRRLPIQVHYLPEPGLFNAFAIPGGHVFIGAALFERLRTEDQLAALLGHEMEHIDHYHCAERLQVEAALRKIPLGELVQFPVEIFQAGYSKEQELEADREGVLLAARAGYSANGAVELFELFANLEGETHRAARTLQEEVATVAFDALTGYFRSHPLMPERIAQVKTMIARQPALAAGQQRPIGLAHITKTRESLAAGAMEDFDRAVELASQALTARSDYTPALEGLAIGEYGRNRVAAGLEAHRRARALDAVVAGRITGWIEARAAILAERRMYGRELALLEAALQLDRTTPLLRLLTVAQIASRDQTGATATATELRRRSPADAAEFAVELQKRAAMLLDASDFAQSSVTARVALVLKPSLDEALQTAAAAEIAQTRFHEAARLCLDMYAPESSGVAWLQTWGDAAGAARSRTAARDLTTLFEERRPAFLPLAAVQVELAGLALVAGDDRPLRDLQPWIADGSLAPDLLVRLGWWCLSAGRTNEAIAILRKAETADPADHAVRNAIAWVLLEQQDAAAAQPDDAAPRLTHRNAAGVRHALTRWQQNGSRDAIAMWAEATERSPQWRNETWRRAFYPARINALAQQLETERIRTAKR